MTLNYFDSIGVLLVVLGALAGFRRGFIRCFAGMAVWGAGCSLSLLLHPVAAGWLNRHFAVEPYWLNPLAFALLLTAALVLLYAIAWLVQQKIPVAAHTARMNKAAGILPGIVAGAVAVMVLVKAGTASLSTAIAQEAGNSLAAVCTARVTYWGEEQLSAVFVPPVEEKISGAHNGAPAVVTTHFTARPDLEAAMLQLVNAEREKYALRPLQPDAPLRVVAAAHAADMFTQGYFAHNSIDGTDPFMRMKRAGIKYHLAGENLAYAAGLMAAHQGLMQSPGHRANILKPDFGRVGIAVLDGGTAGLMFVQEFRD